MSKKSKKTKAVEAAPLSKKERKALAKREAELAAELAQREAERKAAKKAAKKGKGKKAEAAPAPLLAWDNPTWVERKRLRAEKKAAPAPVAPQIEDAKAERKRLRAEKKAAAEKPAPEAEAKPEKKSKARADLDATLAEHDAAIAAKSTPEEQAKIDAEIKARLKVKREERDARLAQAQHDVAENRKERIKAAVAETREVDPEPEAQHVAEVVETDHGREIAVGPASGDDDFAKPSEAPKSFEENVNGLGQYKVARPTDGKVVGYTRWTTYIDCLEDKTALEKWKARILLEGVAAAEEMGDAVTAKVRDLAHRRDVAIAKARKADRKGKLGVGELATYVDGAWADFKKALDKLADEVFEVGGGREKATKGTDIHALCDLAERDGIAAVGDLLTAGEITPSDLADVEAYLDAIRRLGAKPILAEQVVVNDELKVAGRLDRVYMVKLPGEARGRRRVVDLKTGRVDYGTGKIAQQIEGYAGSVAYDPETHERTPLGVDRTLGLLIHLPAGTGKATVHRVDLGLGRKGNKLAGEVRAWRNEGKRAIDLKTDVLEEIAAESDVDAMTGGD